MQIIVEKCRNIKKKLTNLSEQKGERKTVQIISSVYDNDQGIAENMYKFFINSVKEINGSIENMNIEVSTQVLKRGIEHSGFIK